MPQINTARETGSFPLSKGMSDIGRRLVSLADKVGCSSNSNFDGQDWSIELLKDLIYDIDEKVLHL